MAKHQLTGREGEERALDYLIAKGYQIQAVNWRSGQLEIDIIAEKNGILVFVEVKTRSHGRYGSPALAGDARKQRAQGAAALAYMGGMGWEDEIRFDILAVVLKTGGAEIEHFEDAYFPGLDY